MKLTVLVYSTTHLSSSSPYWWCSIFSLIHRRTETEEMCRSRLVLCFPVHSLLLHHRPGGQIHPRNPRHRDQRHSLLLPDALHPAPSHIPQVSIPEQYTLQQLCTSDVRLMANKAHYQSDLRTYEPHRVAYLTTWLSTAKVFVWNLILTCFLYTNCSMEKRTWKILLLSCHCCGSFFPISIMSEKKRFFLTLAYEIACVKSRERSKGIWNKVRFWHSRS